MKQQKKTQTITITITKAQAEERKLRARRAIQFYRHATRIADENFNAGLLFHQHAFRHDPATYGKNEQEGKRPWCHSTRTPPPSPSTTSTEEDAAPIQNRIWGLVNPTFKQQVNQWPNTLREPTTQENTPKRKAWKC